MIQAWGCGATESLSTEQAVAYARRGTAPKPRARAGVGWKALSPTERQMAALSAEGPTTRPIADRLLMKRRTAAAHISHVFSKLTKGVGR